MVLKRLTSFFYVSSFFSFIFISHSQFSFHFILISHFVILLILLRLIILLFSFHFSLLISSPFLPLSIYTIGYVIILSLASFSYTDPILHPHPVFSILGSLSPFFPLPKYCCLSYPPSPYILLAILRSSSPSLNI